MSGETEKMKKGKTADLKVKNWIWSAVLKFSIMLHNVEYIVE
jgi:hypothetical protein